MYRYHYNADVNSIIIIKLENVISTYYMWLSAQCASQTDI